MKSLNVFGSSSNEDYTLRVSFVDEYDSDYNVTEENLIRLDSEIEDKSIERNFIVFDFEGNIIGDLKKMAKERCMYKPNRFKEYSVELPREIGEAVSLSSFDLAEHTRNSFFISSTSYFDSVKEVPAILVNIPQGLGKFKQYILDYDLNVVGKIENNTAIPTESFDIIIPIE